MGKTNRMERRNQSFKDKGSAYGTILRTLGLDYIWNSPTSRDVQRLTEAISGHKRKSK